MFVLVMLGEGCSHRWAASGAAVRSSAPLDPPSPATCAARTTDAIKPELTTDPETDLDLEIPESHIERYEVRSPTGIRVHVSFETLTGTTHVAEELSITTDTGTLRFGIEDFNRERDANPLRTEALPLIERALAAGDHRWVLLGWSSYGEGMQTEHVWLVGDRDGPRIVDSISWTTDRGHAGLAIDAGASVRIGIPLPQPAADVEIEADEEDTALHREDSWELRHGTKRYSLDDVRRLPSTETHVMALRDYYTPPSQWEPSRRHWEGRFVWFASGKVFTLAKHRASGR